MVLSKMLNVEALRLPLTGSKGPIIDKDDVPIFWFVFNISVKPRMRAAYEEKQGWKRIPAHENQKNVFLVYRNGHFHVSWKRKAHAFSLWPDLGGQPRPSFRTTVRSVYINSCVAFYPMGNFANGLQDNESLNPK